MNKNSQFFLRTEMHSAVDTVALRNKKNVSGFHLHVNESNLHDKSSHAPFVHSRTKLTRQQWRQQ